MSVFTSLSLYRLVSLLPLIFAEGVERIGSRDLFAFTAGLAPRAKMKKLDGDEGSVKVTGGRNVPVLRSLSRRLIPSNRGGR